MSDLSISRSTATKYLEQLVEINLLRKDKIWKNNYYTNTALFELLVEGKSFHV